MHHPELSSVFLGPTVTCHFTGTSAPIGIEYSYFCRHSSEQILCDASENIYQLRELIVYSLCIKSNLTDFLVVIRKLNSFKSEIILKLLILFKLQLPNLE
jgi:hypothetical protein